MISCYALGSLGINGIKKTRSGRGNWRRRLYRGGKRDKPGGPVSAHLAELTESSSRGDEDVLS